MEEKFETGGTYISFEEVKKVNVLVAETLHKGPANGAFFGSELGMA